jgi:hypothetical protein
MLRHRPIPNQVHLFVPLYPSFGSETSLRCQSVWVPVHITDLNVFLMEFVGIAVPPGTMDPVQLASSNASCALQQANTRTRCLQQTGLIRGPDIETQVDIIINHYPHTNFIPLQPRYLARELTFGSRLLNGVTQASTYENQSLPSIDDHRGSGSIPDSIFTRAPEHS